MCGNRLIVLQSVVSIRTQTREPYMPNQNSPVTAEQVLRALVESIDVTVPNDGLFQGNTKMMFWHRNPDMGLFLAVNSYEEACLNHIWALL